MTSGAYTEIIVTPNSLFDPLASAGSVQPYFFDQWAALFDIYQVHAYKVSITPTFNSTAITSTSTARYGITPTDSKSAFNNISEAMEQSRTIHKVYQINGGNPQPLSAYVMCHVPIGITRQQYTDQLSTYGAAVGSNPAGLAYLHIWACPVEATTGTVSLDIVFTFYATFHSPIIPAV